MRRCPRCGNTEFRRSRKRDWSNVLLRLLWLRRYRCEKCKAWFIGRRWGAFAAPNNNSRSYREAARTDAPEAPYRVGRIYLEISGGPPEQAEAYRRLLQASEQGMVDARLRLGQLRETPGPMQNLPEAFRWYRLAAEGGSSVAEYKLGCLYQSGSGVESDAGEAARWFLLAAQHGLPSEEPFPGAFSYEEAKSLYLFGAERGDPAAQFHLGDLLESHGRTGEAASWFRQAARQGQPDGQFRLACILANSGNAGDHAEAVELCRTAAEAGVMEAQFTLARIYETGDGLQADLEQALVWYRCAAGQGHKGAWKDLLRLKGIS